MQLSTIDRGDYIYAFEANNLQIMNLGRASRLPCEGPACPECWDIRHMMMK